MTSQPIQQSFHEFLTQVRCLGAKFVSPCDGTSSGVQNSNVGEFLHGYVRKNDGRRRVSGCAKRKGFEERKKGDVIVFRVCTMLYLDMIMLTEQSSFLRHFQLLPKHKATQHNVLHIRIVPDISTKHTDQIKQNKNTHIQTRDG